MDRVDFGFGRDAAPYSRRDWSIHLLYISANSGTTLEVANNTHEKVEGYSKLDLLIKQSGETLVPKLRHNLRSAKQAPKTSGEEVRIHEDTARFGSDKQACCFHVGSSDLYAIETERNASQTTTLPAAYFQQRDVSDVHKVLGQSHDNIAREALKVASCGGRLYANDLRR